MTWFNEDDVCLPDCLPFHFPLETGKIVEQLVPLHGDTNRRYHQLINWCMIERYWTYCINQPDKYRTATQAEYDRVVQEIDSIESLCEDEITVGYCDWHIPLGCSPTKAVFHYLPCRYPHYIQRLFQHMPLNMLTPWKKLSQQVPVVRVKPKLKKRIAETT